MADLDPQLQYAPTPRRGRGSLLALWVLGTILVLTPLGPLFFSFQGINGFPGKHGAYYVFWAAVFFAVLFRRRGSSGWLGAISGFGIGAVVVIAIGAIAHANRNPYEAALREPVFLAIQKIDPAVFEQIKSEARAMPNAVSDSSRAEFLRRIHPHILPLFRRVVAITSDQALRRFVEVKLRQLRELAASSSDDCAALATESFAPGQAVRIAMGASPGLREANVEAMMFVIEQAVGHPPIQKLAKEEGARLVDTAESLLRAKGLTSLNLDTSTTSVSAETRCRTAIALYETVMLLGEPDGSQLLRYLVTP